MRKFLFSLMSLITVSALTAKAQSWCDDLVKLNPGVIDSVSYIESKELCCEDQDTYMIYYHQPLRHDAPELGSLPLRAFFSTNTNTRGEFLQKMVQMSIGGYELSDLIRENANGYVFDTQETSLGEITAEYYGHLLLPEHRYFGFSYPEAYYKSVGYCEAKEAAADFHALAEAMKKVFKGKWCISGVSKGGVAAAVQHAYYPDDADFFVPYVAPFMNGTSDMRLQERWMKEPWTPEMRDHILHIQKEILNRPAVYEYYHKKFFESRGMSEELFRCDFLYNVGKNFANKYMTEKRSRIKQDIDSNMEYLKEKGLKDYSDIMLMYMINGTISLTDGFEGWYKNVYLDNQESNMASSVRNTPRTSAAIRMSESVYGVNQSEWKSSTQVAFAYQTLHELGYYGLKWDYFYDTQAEIDSVNTLWKNNVKSVMDFETNNVLKDVEYDPTLMNFVRQQTKQATKPMLFIYGGDDMWAGAHIEEEYVNGKNVRMYMLPEKNHTASITSPAEVIETAQQEELKLEILAFLNTVFRPETNAIAEVNDHRQPRTTAIYNLNGQRVLAPRGGVGGGFKGIIIQNGKKKVAKI